MDLGGEKFFDIKWCGGVTGVAAVVIVATIKALKMHGVKLSDPGTPDASAVDGVGQPREASRDRGLFGKPAVVALNRFAADTAEEIAVVRTGCQRLGILFAESTHFMDGGKGA